MIMEHFACVKTMTNMEEKKGDEKTSTDVATQKEFLLKKYPQLDQYMKKEDDFIRVAVNLEYVTTNEPLNSKDEIALFPPVSGG
jgi:molybdopterin converting factor small subunit